MSSSPLATQPASGLREGVTQGRRNAPLVHVDRGRRDFRSCFSVHTVLAMPMAAAAGSSISEADVLG